MRNKAKEKVKGIKLNFAFKKSGTIKTKNKKNISLLKTPIRFDTENHVDKTAPELGEHNEEIFTKLGYSIEDINLLKNKDII